MELFKKIFSKISSEPEQPNLKFGRFSDSYKEDKKYDAWDKSLEKFEAKHYLESFKLFLSYLSDDQQENVKFEVIIFSVQFNASSSILFISTKLSFSSIFICVIFDFLSRKSFFDP